MARRCARDLLRRRSDFLPVNSETVAYLFYRKRRVDFSRLTPLPNFGGDLMSQRKPEPTGEFLDPKSFGRLLDLNRESIYRAISRGDLLAVKIGGAIRLPRIQLDALLAGGETHEAP